MHKPTNIDNIKKITNIIFHKKKNHNNNTCRKIELIFNEHIKYIGLYNLQSPIQIFPHYNQVYDNFDNDSLISLWMGNRDNYQVSKYVSKSKTKFLIFENNNKKTCYTCAINFSENTQECAKIKIFMEQIDNYLCSNLTKKTLFFEHFNEFKYIPMVKNNIIIFNASYTMAVRCACAERKYELATLGSAYNYIDDGANVGISLHFILKINYKEKTFKCIPKVESIIYESINKFDFSEVVRKNKYSKIMIMILIYKYCNALKILPRRLLLYLLTHYL